MKCIIIFLIFLSILSCNVETDNIFFSENYSYHSQALISSEQDNVKRLYPCIFLDVVLNFPDLSYNVYQKINYINNQIFPLSELYFRTFMNSAGGRLLIHTIYLDGKSIEINKEEKNDTYFFITLPEKLLPENHIVIELEYKVVIPNSQPKNSRLFGFYKDCLMFDYFYSSLVVPDKKECQLNDPLPYGDLVFNEVALFTVDITYPDNFIFSSSGKAIESQRIDEKIIKDRIISGPVRSFFLAGGFSWKKYTKKYNETIISIIGPEEAKEGLLLGLQYAYMGMATLSKILCPYPYTEFDIVYVPGGWSAMEYSGIIAMGNNYIDKDSQIFKAPGFGNYETILIHELIHQWFFNYVGNDQINESWLDEAFAQFFVKYYYSDHYNQDKANTYIDFLKGVCKITNSNNIPINQSVAEFKNGAEYTAVVYGRAALLLLELEESYGSKSFIEFISWYLQKHKWEIIDTDTFLYDLDEFFGDGSGEKIKHYFKTDSLQYYNKSGY